MSFIKNLSIPRISNKLLAAAIFFVLCFFAHASAHAATLSLSPSSGTYAAGKTISVRVLVNSAGQSINAVSGNVTFSTDTLTLTGISKSGIVTLWAQDPTYSNSSGTASFQGVILNGYTGAGGTVLTLTFKAKGQGTATVNISSGGSSVLLNDGQGTNALSGTSGATFVIVPGSTAPSTPVSPSKPVTPNKPVQPTNPVVPTEVAKNGAAPLFTDYQSPLLPGNFVVVKGTASPNSLVTVTFTHSLSNGTTTVTQTTIPATAAGTFAFVSDEKVSEGSKYSLVAATVDGQHTEALALSVKNSLGFVLGAWIAAIFAIKIAAWLAVLLIAMIAGYVLYRNHILKEHLEMAVDKVQELENK